MATSPLLRWVFHLPSSANALRDYVERASTSAVGARRDGELGPISLNEMSEKQIPDLNKLVFRRNGPDC
jgi:hypothetical protein